MKYNFIKPAVGGTAFNNRGGGSSRMESLCDGIFALAIAMLLISTSVPTNFSELSQFVADLIPFGICSIFVFWIWREHVVFFQRYGLTEDKVIVRYSYLLLMLVLFFVYALKFLMTWIIQFFAGAFRAIWFKTPLYEQVQVPASMVSFHEMPWLMLIYALGFLSVFGVFAMMYHYVLQRKELLELNDKELVYTRFSYKQQLTSVGTALVSMFFALIGLATGWAWAGFFAGMAYNLLWVSTFVLVRGLNKDLAALEKE